MVLYVIIRGYFKVIIEMRNFCNSLINLGIKPWEMKSNLRKNCLH